MTRPDHFDYREKAQEALDRANTERTPYRIVYFDRAAESGTQNCFASL